MESNPLNHLLKEMRALIARVLCNEDPRIILPSHGGGSTACKTENRDKYHKLRYYPKLDDIYPYDDLFFYSATHLIDEWDKLEKSIVSNPQARVCLVPKDSRGPRIISCEPCELMFAQQGIMNLMYRILETHHLTAGQINFTDQSINRELARSASMTGEYSTIDLSDASDRVSLRLVELVFPPVWVECFKACRSDTTLLPDGTVVKLQKFAPMGSSCCFPVEALVFWACAEASTKYIPGFKSRSVFVYGDDIIIRTEMFDAVIEGLTSVGLLVNENKSYRGGPFRESCGGDYHIGYDVTPVRLKKPLLSHGTGIVEAADLANLFIAKFGYHTVHRIIDSIQEAIGYVFPRTLRVLPCTLRSTPTASNDYFFAKRWNYHYQRTEYRVRSHHVPVKTWHPPNWGELHRMELTKHARREKSNPLLRPHEDEEEIVSRYEHQSKILDAKLNPGQYADVQSAHTKWTWMWLG